MDPASAFVVEALAKALLQGSPDVWKRVPSPMLRAVLHELLEAAAVISDELDARTLP